MKFVPPDRWRAILLAYCLGGLALGLCNRPLNLLALNLGIRPGLGTALDVNILMSVFAVVAAFFYPRIWTAWLGGFLGSAAFYFGMRLVQSPNVTTWSAKGSFLGVHPILVAACLGYGVLGTLTSVTVRPWRIVGLADAHLRCKSCGYLLIGLGGPKCPECGTAFDRDAIDASRRCQ